MDFLLKNSGVVKVLAEDDEVTMDMLLPPDKKDAVADFVKHIEILAALSEEPNIGVKRMLEGLCPYVCLDGLSSQTHENLLFLIDYFDLPDKLAKRVYLSKTRDIEATFPDVLEANALKIYLKKEEAIYRKILFWIAVCETDEIREELQKEENWSFKARIGIKLCGKTNNKECFDFILSCSGIRILQDSWENNDPRVLKWLCQDYSYSKRLSFEELVLRNISEKDLECIKVLFHANKTWCESFDTRIMFIRAIRVGSMEIVEYLYSIINLELDTDIYTFAAAKENIFVWLCEKKKPTMDISVIGHSVLREYIVENIKYFHENIQAIQENDVNTCFLNTDLCRSRVPSNIHEVFRFYVSLGINIASSIVCQIAIIYDSPKTLNLLHKLGYKFNMDDLGLALESPDGYGWHTEAFLAIHRHLNYCKLPHDIKSGFMWDCSFEADYYNQKLKYLAACKKYRNIVKTYCMRCT